jgi:hypothetical protein
MIIQSALICELELEQWEQHLPEIWRPEIIFSTKPEVSRHHRAYRDAWSRRIWSHYHWSRILVNELLLAYLAKLKLHTLKHELQRVKSLQMISQIASDICTSVPAQFIHGSIEFAAAEPLPRMTGVFLLLFPLAVAGAPGVPDDLHLWVIKVLGQIGHTMGVRQTLALIASTKMRREGAKTRGQGCWR